MFGRSPPTPFIILFCSRAQEKLGSGRRNGAPPGGSRHLASQYYKGRGRGEEESHFEHFVIWCSLGPPQVVHHFVNVPLNLRGIKGFSFLVNHFWVACRSIEALCAFRRGSIDLVLWLFACLPLPFPGGIGEWRFFILGFGGGPPHRPRPSRGHLTDERQLYDPG